MADAKSLQRHFGSLFITATFLDTFSGGLASNISMTVGTAKDVNGAPNFKHSTQAVFPMASVLSATQYTCGRMRVDDEHSLAEMLESIRQQFQAAEECNAADKTFALEVLEHVFAFASRNAQLALQEVQAGYPTSGGDFPGWMDELLRS